MLPSGELQYNIILSYPTSFQRISHSNLKCNKIFLCVLYYIFLITSVLNVWFLCNEQLIDYFSKKHRKEMRKKCIKGPPTHQLRSVNICCHLVNYNTILFYHMPEVFDLFRTRNLKCNKIFLCILYYIFIPNYKCVKCLVFVQ